MGVKIKESVTDPAYMNSLVDKRLKESLQIMAEEIHKKALELEPPQSVKDSFAERIRRIIHGK